MSKHSCRDIMKHLPRLSAERSADSEAGLFARRTPFKNDYIYDFFSKL